MPDTIVSVPLGTTASQLQSMIDAADPHTTFQLEAGTYFFDQTLVINQSHVSIAGAGRDATTITMPTNIGDDSVIQIGHALHSPEIERTIDIVQPASVGDTQLTLASNHTVEVGDYLYVQQENTSAFFAEIGDTQWRKDKPLRIIMVEVTAVNGDTVTFDTPLTFDYDPAISTVQIRTIVEGNSLSDFTIEGPYGTANPGTFSNTQGSGTGQTMIMLGGTADANISNIGIVDGISHGITIAGSTDLTLDDFYMNGTHNKGSGGNGYSIWIRDVFNSDFSNIWVEDTRHAVLFGGYNTASGNNVHVTYTNRDVNFHGGRDQFNTVVVDSMVRLGAEQGYMAWATFYNEGERYGAPTDPTTNPIYIRELVASSKGDSVVAHPDGAQLWLVGGNDTVVTGAGNDFVDGGSGSDRIYASDGMDTINGGSSYDTLVLSGTLADYSVTMDGSDIYLTHAGGKIKTNDIDNFLFADVELGDWEMEDIATVEANPFTDPDPALPTQPTEGPADGVGDDTTGGSGSDDTTGGSGGDDTTGGSGGDDTTGGSGGDDTTGGSGGDDTTGGTGGDDTTGGSGGDDTTGGSGGADPADDPIWQNADQSGLAVITGETWWDRYRASDSFVMGADMDAMEFANQNDLDVFGNDLDNNMLANDGNNRVEGGAGNDRMFGRDGDDTMLGDDGNDLVDGGAGNDALTGGAGNDTVEGGNGDDTMLASAGNDTLNGEAGTDTALFADALSSYTITGGSGTYTISKDGSSWRVQNTEVFVFDGQVVQEADLLSAYADALAGGDDTTGGSGGDDTTGGSGGDDTTGGSGGDDTTGGSGGDDTTGGSGGDDTTGGSGGDDTTGGSGGDDTTGGSGGDDTTGGSGGDDTTGGSGGDDTTGGSGGDDTTGGSGGDDTTGGSGGDDTTGGSGGDDTTGGSGGDDTTGGSGGDDTTGGSSDPYPGLWNEMDPGNLLIIDGTSDSSDYARADEDWIMGDLLENGRFKTDNDLNIWGNDLVNDINGNDGDNRIEGRGGDDRLDGYDGNDTILGGAGDDHIEGDRDDDLIHGGDGNDTLEGNDGNDTFVYLEGGDADRIKDFDDGNNHLILGIDGVSSVAQAMTYASYDGRDVTFDFGNGDVLQIDDVTLNEIMNNLTVL